MAQPPPPDPKQPVPLRPLVDPFDPATLAAIEGLELKARYLMEGFLSGLHRSPFHGVSVEFSDYRHYLPGDDLRHLDWHLFARSDRLCIKRYHQDTNLPCYLLCDTSASMAYQGAGAWSSKLDAARLLGAAMGRLLLKQNDAVGLLALGAPEASPTFLRPSQRASPFGLLLHHLQQLQPEPGERLAPLLQTAARLLQRRSLLILFSDFLEPLESIQAPLQRLRYSGHECLLLQILDPDELDFPFSEPRTFLDPDTGISRLIDPLTARASYLEAFRAFTQQQTDFFRSLEISHCVLRTDQSPWEALSLFLAQRNRAFA